MRRTCALDPATEIGPTSGRGSRLSSETQDGPSGKPRRRKADPSDPPEPDAAGSPDDADAPRSDPQVTRDSGPSSAPGRPAASALSRYAFYLVWVVGLPLALAILVVWLFTPAPNSGAVGGLPTLISEQQLPFGILFFTVFVIVVWRFRYELPLSDSAGIGGRRDVPQRLRGRFEEAGALLDEARRILKARRREIERELTSGEREQVMRVLDDLDEAVHGDTFVPASFERAHTRADRLIGEHLGRWRKGEIREYAESIAIAVGVALLLRGLVVEAFKIPSGSMIPTLMIGDHIFVNKLSYGPLVPFTESRFFADLPPDRGDVMVFKYPEKPEQDFIKRVIAGPGDTLEVVDGRPILNGWVVPHCRVGTFEHDGKTSELYVEYLGERIFFTLFDSLPPEKTCESSRDCDGLGMCYAGLCGNDYKSFHVAPGEVWVMGDNRNNSHDSRSWFNGRGGGVPFDNIKGRAMFVFATFGPGESFRERMLVNVMGRPRLPEAQSRLQGALDKCLREVPTRTSPPNP